MRRSDCLTSNITFYQFLLTHRGEVTPTEKGRLAEWAFHDFGFPKYSTRYDEISEYLELNSPFPEALQVFDELWELYKM